MMNDQLTNELWMTKELSREYVQGFQTRHKQNSTDFTFNSKSLLKEKQSLQENIAKDKKVIPDEKEKRERGEI